MDELVEMAQGLNDKLEAFIVLNRVSTNPAVREDQDTRDFFQQENFQNMTMVESVLRDRIAFRKSARDGLSVQEWKQDKKATDEITQLFEEVYGG
jgi:chromosome partitioning protein